MGRTEPTFRHLLDRLEHEWRDYRRGLTLDEQAAFDALFQRARAHASASSNVARADPMESVFLSMLLEHELAMRKLARSVRLASGMSSAARGAVREEGGAPLPDVPDDGAEQAPGDA